MMSLTCIYYAVFISHGHTIISISPVSLINPLEVHLDFSNGLFNVIPA